MVETDFSHHYGEHLDELVEFRDELSIKHFCLIISFN